MCRTLVAQRLFEEVATTPEKKKPKTSLFIVQPVQMLTSLINKFQLDYKPFNIWNIDETGIPDIPQEQRVIGVKGENCSQTVSGEKPAIPHSSPLSQLEVYQFHPWSSLKEAKSKQRHVMLPHQDTWYDTQRQNTSNPTYLQTMVKSWWTSSGRRN